MVQGESVKGGGWEGSIGDASTFCFKLVDPPTSASNPLVPLVPLTSATYPPTLVPRPLSLGQPKIVLANGALGMPRLKRLLLREC